MIEKYLTIMVLSNKIYERSEVVIYHWTAKSLPSSPNLFTILREKVLSFRLFKSGVDGVFRQIREFVIS